MPIITARTESALQLLQTTDYFFTLMLLKDEETQLNLRPGKKKRLNMFWGLIFNSNEKMSCCCCINFESLFLMRSHTLVFFHQHHKTGLRSAATPDNLLDFRSHSEWMCTAPGSHATTRGGQSWHIPKSGETQPRPAVPGDLRESHNDSVSKEIRSNSCHSRAGLLISHSPLPPPFPSPSLYSVFFRNSN